MKIAIGRLTIQWNGANVQRSTFNVQRSMAEADVAVALNVSEKNPVWRAVLQLLGEFEEGARRNIGAEPDKAGLVTWNAGGAEYIAQFRQHLIQRRAEAMDGFRREPNKLKRVVTTAGMRDGSGRVPGDEGGE